MLRSRLAAATAVAGALLAAPLLATAPASAAPAAGYITAESFNTDSPSSNPGLLSVTLASDMPITSMTVDLVPQGGSTAALSLPMSDFGVPAENGTGFFVPWTVTSAITTDQLPLGAYSVEVTATSADASVTDIAAGVLLFKSQVTFPAFTSNGTTFSYENQNVTFTGTADVTAPGGSPQPFGNANFDLVDNAAGDSWPFATAPDGTFSVTVPAKSIDFWVTYAGDATTQEANSAPIAITVSPFGTKVTAKLSVPHAKYGQADQLTGTATYSSGGVTKPLVGQTVGLYPPNSYFVGATPYATAVTGTGGQYTMAMPTRQGAGSWTVAVAQTQYFTASSTSVNLTVAMPNYITGFHGKLDSFGVLTFTGCVGSPTGTVNIQYAAKLGGPWRTLGRWKPLNGDSCQHGSGYGSYYSTSFGARLGAAYYRAVYTPNYNFQGVTTRAVFLAKHFTKITGFKVSPTTVRRGSKFKVTGRLMAQGKGGKWTPYAHKRIWIFFYYQGTYYYYVSHPATNRNGYFSGKFPVAVTAPVFAQYNGDSTHFASASNRIRVHMTAAPARTPSLLWLGIGLRIARTPAVPGWLG